MTVRTENYGRYRKRLQSNRIKLAKLSADLRAGAHSEPAINDELFKLTSLLKRALNMLDKLARAKHSEWSDVLTQLDEVIAEFDSKSGTLAGLPTPPTVTTPRLLRAHPGVPSAQDTNISETNRDRTG